MSAEKQRAVIEHCREKIITSMQEINAIRKKLRQIEHDLGQLPALIEFGSENDNRTTPWDI